MQEHILSLCTGRRIQTGMIGHRLDSIGHQCTGQLFCSLTVKGINNTTLAFMLRDKSYNMFQYLVFGTLRYYFIIQVGPVKGRNKYLWCSQLQVFNDIVLHFRCSGGGQGNNWQIGVDLFDHGTEFTVFRAEIMSPLRNTVCFIHCYK
ncbi:hypothetical protein D3C80_1069270 [compost metagenome]